MKLSFTHHARTRMLERSIKLSHIKQVLKKPDYQSSTHGNAIQARKKVDKENLEIIYKTTINKVVIITLYYL